MEPNEGTQETTNELDYEYEQSEQDELWAEQQAQLMEDWIWS